MVCSIKWTKKWHLCKQKISEQAIQIKNYFIDYTRAFAKVSERATWNARKASSLYNKDNQVICNKIQQPEQGLRIDLVDT